MELAHAHAHARTVKDQTETATNAAPIIAKKRKRKYKMKYQQMYTNNWEKDKRAEKYICIYFKLDRLEIDKEGSLEWLRRDQLN